MFVFRNQKEFKEENPIKIMTKRGKWLKKER